VTASEIQPKRPAPALETARPAAPKAASRRKSKSTGRTSSKSRPSEPVASEPLDADEIPF
jgi:hypothetical protein